MTLQISIALVSWSPPRPLYSVSLAGRSVLHVAASPVPNSNLWDQVRAELQSNLSKPTFETWIRPAVCVSAEQRRLVLEAPNPFAAGWLRRNYLGLIAEVASAISGGPVEVQIQAGDEASSEPVCSVSKCFAATRKCYHHAHRSDCSFLSFSYQI